MELKPGDQVEIYREPGGKNKDLTGWRGPARLIGRTADNQYEVEWLGKIKTVTAREIRRCIDVFFLAQSISVKMQRLQQFTHDLGSNKHVTCSYVPNPEGHWMLSRCARTNPEILQDLYAVAYRELQLKRVAGARLGHGVREAPPVPDNTDSVIVFWRRTSPE